jgi:hypothetical protein
MTTSDMTEGTRRGEMLLMRSDHLEVVVDPGYGAEIVSITSPGSPVNALAHHDWMTPARARDGQRYPTVAQDWLSNYRGGWQECFPNSGAESSVAGTVTPFHGEVSTTAWQVLEATATDAVLQVPTRLPLVLTRRMRLAADAPVLYVEERVQNVGTFDVDCVWGHHPVFPAVPGTTIDLPSCAVEVEPANHDGVDLDGGSWPVIPGAAGDVDLSQIDDATIHRLTYQHSLAQGWVALRPPAGAANPGIAMAWDIETWPNLWMWLMAGTVEFPWYGRARWVGLEPNRSRPFDGLDGAVGRGQQLTVPAGTAHEAWLTFRLLDNPAASVNGMDRDGILVNYR